MSETTVRKFKFIGCEILYREACYLAATGHNQVDIEFLRKGLHDLETADMRTKVQSAINAVDNHAGYEAILLGYARCNDGLVGVTARDIPLVIPRAHDCITFFFGSRRTFQGYFDEHPGTYYMTTGWSERNAYGDGQESHPAYGKQGVMGKLGLADTYEQMVHKYGKENADFIRQTMGDWTQNYRNMLYLKMGICDESACIAAAREKALQRSWQFEAIDGNLALLMKLFAGQWDEDFLIVPPGRSIVARNDEAILEVS